MTITDKCSLPSITAIMKVQLKSTILSVKRILNLKIKMPSLKACFATGSHLSLSMSQPKFTKFFPNYKIQIKYHSVDFMLGLSKIRNVKEPGREKLLNKVSLEKLNSESY